MNVETVELQPAVIGEGVASHRPLLAALIARLLLEEVEAGRWVKLPDGTLVPVDRATINVVQLFQEVNPE